MRVLQLWCTINPCGAETGISRDNSSWYHGGLYLLSLRCHVLTHWGRATHICVSEIIIIGSDNGLSPGRRQAIIWTNAGILLIRTLGTNFSEILGEIHSFSFSKIHLKMSSAKWRLFGLGLNELNNNCIAYAKLTGPCLSRRGISTTFIIAVLRKSIRIFPNINFTRQGFISVQLYNVFCLAMFTLPPYSHSTMRWCSLFHCLWLLKFVWPATDSVESGDYNRTAYDYSTLGRSLLGLSDKPHGKAW